MLVLPQGAYRFRADFNGTQFWSGEDTVSIPGVTMGTHVTINTIKYTYGPLYRLTAADYSTG